MGDGVNYMMTGMRPQKAPGKPHDMYEFIRPQAQSNDKQDELERINKLTSKFGAKMASFDLTEDESAIEEELRNRMSTVLELIAEHQPTEDGDIIDGDEIIDDDVIEEEVIEVIEVETVVLLPPPPPKAITPPTTQPLPAVSESKKSILNDSSRRRTTDSKFNGMTDEERELLEREKTLKALKAIRKLEDEVANSKGLRKGSGLWVRLFNMKRNFLIARDFSGFMDPYSLDKISWTPKQKECILKRFDAFTNHITIPAEDFLKSSSQLGVLGTINPKILSSTTKNGVTVSNEEDMKSYSKEHIAKIYG